MERSIQKNGLINLLALLAVGVAGLAVARYANSLAGQVGVLFLGIGVLVAAVSWFQMRLEDRERLEKLELEELAKTHGGSALFEARGRRGVPGAALARAVRAVLRAGVHGAAVPAAGRRGVFALALAVAEHDALPEVKQPITGLALFGVFALVLFLLGRFSATIARLEHHRLLRPGASYLLFNAFLCLVVALGHGRGLGRVSRRRTFTSRTSCAVCWRLVAVETLVQLVLEIYRPRVKGKVERPLYESRLVGLAGPAGRADYHGGASLDYQFGFKVSETWFYRFFEKALGWLVLLQVGALVLSTCVVFIDAGEQGVLEHFGNAGRAARRWAPART